MLARPARVGINEQPPPAAPWRRCPARGVTNILLQSQCAVDQGEHLSMPYDHIADRDVLNALDPAHRVPPACTPVLPIVGG